MFQHDNFLGILFLRTHIFIIRQDRPCSLFILVFIAENVFPVVIVILYLHQECQETGSVSDKGVVVLMDIPCSSIHDLISLRI